jgi:hypothetical protein
VSHARSSIVSTPVYNTRAPILCPTLPGHSSTANAWDRYRHVATGAFARDRDPAVDSAATWLVGERANGLAKCVHGGEEPP